MTLPSKMDSQTFTVHQEHPLNAEPDVEDLVNAENGTLEWTTPEQKQYFRNHGEILHLPREGYKLHIDVEPELKACLQEKASGTDVKVVNTGSISLDKVLDIGKVDLSAALQCAGNRREELNDRKEVEGILWKAGTILNAEWEGVPLRSLLVHLGVPSDFSQIKQLAGAHVHFFSQQKCEQADNYEASIPLTDAMDPTRCVLLADTMNGQALSAEHGGPLRVVVPGFIGARSVKWLHTLRLKSAPSSNFYMTKDYKKLPPSVTSENKEEWMKKVEPLQDTGIQSAVAKVDADGRDNLTVQGYAFDGAGSPISQVQVCIMVDDHGATGDKQLIQASRSDEATWTPAELEQEKKGSGEKVWSWTLFSASIPLLSDWKGHKLCALSRAVTNDGKVQEAVTDWNIRGVENQGYGIKRGIYCP